MARRYHNGGGNNLLWIVVILLVFSAIGAGTLNFSNLGSVMNSKSSVGGECPDTGTVTALLRARNPLNSSADWLQPTVYLSTMGGDTMFSEALNEASAGAYDDDETGPPCNSHYRVTTKNDGDYVYAETEIGPMTSAEESRKATLLVARSSEVEFMAFDSSYGNQTKSDAWEQDVTTTTAEAVGSGGSLTYIVKYRAKTGAAQFGSDEVAKAPTWICIDADPTKFSKDNGVVLSGGGVHGRIKDNLPRYCSVNGYEVAYKIPPVKSTDGEKQITVTIRADLGDPTTDVKLLFIDSHAFDAGDGSVQVGTADDGSTAVGETDRYVTINLS